MKVNFDECYPFNVMKKVLGDSYENYNFSHTFILNVFQEDLSKREQKVLELRFIDNLTLEECGKELGVSKERVRQIEAKVFRKISSPDRISKMDAVSHAAYQKSVDAYLKAIAEISKFLVLCHVEEPNKILEKQIRELNISVRPYNYLKRADISTIGDSIYIKEGEIEYVQ